MKLIYGKTWSQKSRVRLSLTNKILSQQCKSNIYLTFFADKCITFLIANSLNVYTIYLLLDKHCANLHIFLILQFCCDQPVFLFCKVVKNLFEQAATHIVFRMVKTVQKIQACCSFAVHVNIMFVKIIKKLISWKRLHMLRGSEVMWGILPLFLSNVCNFRLYFSSAAHF